MRCRPADRAALALAGVLGLGLVTGACAARTSPERAGPSATTPTAMVAAARATIEQWRQAYEIRSVEALAPLYARDVDLVVVREGTTFVGWSSVEAMLKDRIARLTDVRIRLKDVQVRSLAPGVASALATMTRELTEGASTLTENGTLTLVLREQDGAWVITSEHYSYRRP